MEVNELGASAPFLSVEVVGKTIPLVKDVEIKNSADFIMYMAKVSNPSGQADLSRKGLIEYLKKNSHWSPFEMCHYVVEVEAPRDISRQILRHATARFQEFSQRYAEVQKFTVRELRRQDDKNRQNSIDDFSDEEKLEFERNCKEMISYAQALYFKWLERGAAKECARVFLPEGLTMSRLYMAAPVRTWIHYLDLREGNGTQKEHILVANQIREKLREHDPDIF
jgi:thymidylate synthase (FAD)